MKIEEINIEGFGKFHKYHCQTSGKLEVFYGKNESGKTTLRKFMIANAVWAGEIKRTCCKI